MKIILTQTINDLSGKPLQNNEKKVVTLGEVLSNVVIASEEQGKMKLFLLAKKFFEQESIDLDASDLALVKKVVSNSRTYGGTLVLGQVELLLEGAK